MAATSSVSVHEEPYRGRSLVDRLVHTTDDVLPTIARLALGIVIFPHGSQKALGWFGGSGFSATIGHFHAGAGLPVWLAVLVVAAEFLGSLGLIFGLLSRVAAFGVASVMVGAIALVHRHVGFFMNWTGTQRGEGFEYHLLAIALALVVMVGGGGRGSIDRMITRRAQR